MLQRHVSCVTGFLLLVISPAWTQKATLNGLGSGLNNLYRICFAQGLHANIQVPIGRYNGRYLPRQAAVASVAY